MIIFDIKEMRNITKQYASSADFDSPYFFYYDETNNIRKFYVNEFDFNYSYESNFVLGGLVHEGDSPDIQPLFDSLSLQKTIKEVKFKHIAKGNFIDCLKSEKLRVFLHYLLQSKLYIHYSSLNILYWSIVDIVDSAVVNSEAALKIDPDYLNYIKNDLYKLTKLEIDSVIELFYKFGYPNIKKASIVDFIEELTWLFDKYIDTEEFHFGLESLRQILKEAKRKNSLPFITDEEDHVLINDFSVFYIRPIWLYKNSNHIFDNESTISDMLDEYKIIDGDKIIKNYSFVDSKIEPLVQASDILVGLVGKLSNYLNTSSNNVIKNDFKNMSPVQTSNIDLLIDLIDKSNNKNIGFLHAIDSFEEMSKMNLIREIRNKNFV